MKYNSTTKMDGTLYAHVEAVFGLYSENMTSTLMTSTALAMMTLAPDTPLMIDPST